MDELLLQTLAKFWCSPDLDIVDLINELEGAEARLEEIHAANS